MRLASRSPAPPCWRGLRARPGGALFPLEEGRRWRYELTTAYDDGRPPTR
jgi:hypothetical protein